MKKLALSAAFASVLAFAPAAQAHVQLITITMSNFAYAPDKLDLVAGSDYQFHFVNTSSSGHDFASPELFAAGTVAPEDAAKVVDGSVEVDKGQTVDVRFTATKKGSYEVRCTHFLHSAFGMKGTATIQ